MGAPAVGSRKLRGGGVKREAGPTRPVALKKMWSSWMRSNWTRSSGPCSNGIRPGRARSTAPRHAWCRRCPRNG